MHMHRQAKLFCMGFQPQLHHTGRHPSAPGVEEQRILAVGWAVCLEQVFPDCQPFFQCGNRCFTNRHGAGLATFAGDGDFFFVQVQPADGAVILGVYSMDIKTGQF